MTSPPSNDGVDHAAVIEAVRARGEHRVDPVRFRFIEALARRAGGHQGLARRLLDERVCELLAAYRDDAGRRPPAAPRLQELPAARGPLGALVDALDGHAALPGGWTELKTLRDFRRTWSRLHADQQLTESLAKVPDQAGPLNSQHLVHRTLSLMRDLSPGYLDRFMAYVDALSWLEQVNGSPAVPVRQEKGARLVPVAGTGKSKRTRPGSKPAA